MPARIAEELAATTSASKLSPSGAGVVPPSVHGFLLGYPVVYTFRDSARSVPTENDGTIHRPMTLSAVQGAPVPGRRRCGGVPDTGGMCGAASGRAAVQLQRADGCCSPGAADPVRDSGVLATTPSAHDACRTTHMRRVMHGWSASACAAAASSDGVWADITLTRDAQSTHAVVL